MALVLFGKYRLIVSILVSVLLWLLIVNSQAETKPIYKTVDENGRTVFTDNPPANESTEAVDLKETNIQPGGQTYNGPEEKQSRPQNAMTLAMTSPMDGEQYGPIHKSVTFIVDTSRSLTSREGLVFYMDGEALNSPSSSTTYTLSLGIKLRGKHSIYVALVNKQSNQVLAQSSPVSFYVIRP